MGQRYFLLLPLVNLFNTPARIFIQRDIEAFNQLR